MTLDIAYIRDRYNDYNNLYFYGKLGKCEFRFYSKNMSYAGGYTRKVLKNGVVKSQIWLGKGVKWNEDVFRAILVHEMIHMYIETVEHKRFFGILGHGSSFQRHARRLKKEHGLEIKRHGGYEYIDNRPGPALWERLLLWLIDR